MQHFLTASEIFMQFYFLADGGRILFFCRIRFIFFHKQLRSCQPEPIDALFYVPHHKPVKSAVFFAGYRTHQTFLNQVAVLVLVDHHFLIELPQQKSCFRRRFRLFVN